MVSRATSTRREHHRRSRRRAVAASRRGPRRRSPAMARSTTVLASVGAPRARRPSALAPRRTLARRGRRPPTPPPRARATTGASCEASTSSVKVTFVDASSGSVIEHVAVAGANLLAAAASAGAVSLEDGGEWCLEGRCGTCAMEILGEEGGHVSVFSCRTSVRDRDMACVVGYGASASRRLGDDTMWTT